MGNCSGRLRNSDVPEDIVDLNKILEELAKDRISARRLSYAEKLCLEKSIKLEVSSTKYRCLANNEIAWEPRQTNE